MSITQLSFVPRDPRESSLMNVCNGLQSLAHFQPTGEFLVVKM